MQDAIIAGRYVDIVDEYAVKAYSMHVDVVANELEVRVVGRNVRTWENDIAVLGTTDCQAAVQAEFAYARGTEVVDVNQDSHLYLLL
jgi:hypothetical protein